MAIQKLFKLKVFLENWREFGIDIKARDVVDETALDKIKHRHYYSYSHYEPYVHIKKMLEDDYAKIDVTESV